MSAWPALQRAPRTLGQSRLGGGHAQLHLMGNANISQLWSAAREAVWLPQQRVTHKRHRSITALFVGWLGAGKLEQYKRQKKWAGGREPRCFHALYVHWIIQCFFLVYPY